MPRQHSAAVLASAVPTIRRALAHFERRGDGYQAAKAREALAICLQPPARTFADEYQDLVTANNAPANNATASGATAENPVLDAAHRHLVQVYLKAKEKGD